MTDIFKQLAQTLDQMPEGFPATESGVEIKILKKIYSVEAAEMFLNLKRLPETAEEVAERLGKPVDETREMLDDMAIKGQLANNRSRGQQRYMTAPFVPGIYEYQINRLDRELVDLVEAYFPFLNRTLGGFAPSVGRILPIHEIVKSESSVQPYDDVRELLEVAKSFKILDCICRKEKAILGEGCNHILEACLNFSSEENAYDHFILAGRVIDKEEALEIIEKSAEDGLVHNLVYNVKEGYGAVCNCCSCCCGLLKAAKEYNAPFIIAKSNFIATINQDDCSVCGTCAEERCPMDAIIMTDGTYFVNSETCIGCGVCIIDCPTESITLKLKPEADQESPPTTMVDWFEERRTSRGLS
ncbi:MAG: 4Fe-4S binding protein [Deltaproteobacteria bacterium]|nr:4Fe-4S binding protein [Deltaproteobacteria bacterium]MBT7888100.1 4Fe-4S binding protein [Deltaproteobacteria bacterium]